MRKAIIISDFLKDKNRAAMKAACDAAGFEAVFFNRADEASAAGTDGEVLYTPSPAPLSCMPGIRWCHSSNAGVNDFVASGFFDSGKVMLTNSSGSYGRAISEYIIMVTLMLMKQMPEYLRVIEERGWVHSLPIRSIAGSRIAIAGTGDLGRSAAEKFRGLGAASVTGFSRSGREVQGFDAVYRVTEMDDHLADLDVLVLCLPETPETIGIMNAARLAKLPDTAYIVNVGRGSAVDQETLVKALKEGRLAGAALDVVYPEPLPADHPLWTAPRCIVTPHIAGDMGLEYTVDRTAEIFCENVKRYAAGEALINRIDPAEGY